MTVTAVSVLVRARQFERPHVTTNNHGLPNYWRSGIVRVHRPETDNGVMKKELTEGIKDSTCLESNLGPWYDDTSQAEIESTRHQ